MGQERMLFLTIGIIFVSIAIGVGFFLFSTSARSANREGIVQGINTLSVQANEYLRRPPNLGGGGGSYSGYVIPAALSVTYEGTYAATVSQKSILFTGTSARGYGSVIALLDSTGQLKNFTFTGEFQ